MTSGMRHIFSEALLWLSVFIIALVAFFYLDDRIGAYLDQQAEQQVEARQHTAEAVQLNEQPAQQEEGSSYGRVVLQAGRDGHFEVNAYINDSSVKLIADTGATYVALSYEDADSLGLTYNLKYTGRARTANGVTKVAPVILQSIQVGDIEVKNVKAFVHEEGALHISLLGMSFIGRLERFEMSGRQLVLIQ
ncbi:MAG: TIGR02281 family clan AA aspartic protease [bacterium]|nr:TIGR02281 family clan AA aspartic protease [bacterium]